MTWTMSPDVFVSSDIAERDYCKDCGSTIGMRYHFQADSLGIAIGTMDKECNFSTAPTIHIFIKDKPAWFDIPDDGGKRYAEHNTDSSILQLMQEWEQHHQTTA